MRFRPPDVRRQRPVSGAVRRRMWMLLAMLGMVLLLMRQFQQPATVEKLGRLFSIQEKEVQTLDVEKQADPATGGPDDVPIPMPAAAERRGADLKPLAIDRKLLAGVKDNTFLRESENEAWLAMLAAAQRQSAGQMEKDSVGPIAYAPLIKQPQVYRGQVVTVRGRVLREESLPAVANDLGFESYHRLVIAPEGGGAWPYVVYCLTLPDDFPRGDNLREQVTAHGYFFKSWSYRSTDGGLELAPLLVAPSIQWTPTPIVAVDSVRQSPRPSPYQNLTRLVWGVLAAALIAGAAAWWVGIQTQRKPARNSHNDRTAAADLARLAELEAKQ